MQNYEVQQGEQGYEWMVSVLVDEGVKGSLLSPVVCGRSYILSVAPGRYMTAGDRAVSSAIEVSLGPRMRTREACM